MPVNYANGLFRLHFCEPMARPGHGLVNVACRRPRRRHCLISGGPLRGKAVASRSALTAGCLDERAHTPCGMAGNGHARRQSGPIVPQSGVGAWPVDAKQGQSRQGGGGKHCRDNGRGQGSPVGPMGHYPPVPSPVKPYMGCHGCSEGRRGNHMADCHVVPAVVVAGVCGGV